jgi:mono/diheme cytochrome c family protein
VQTKRIGAAVVLAIWSSSALGAADGAALFASKCSPCHGASGEGAKFAPRPIAGLPRQVVEAVLRDGFGKMRPPQGVTADERAALARYVAGLRGESTSAPPVAAGGPRARPPSPAR